MKPGHGNEAKHVPTCLVIPRVTSIKLRSSWIPFTFRDRALSRMQHDISAFISSTVIPPSSSTLRLVSPSVCISSYSIGAPHCTSLDTCSNEKDLKWSVVSGPWITCPWLCTRKATSCCNWWWLITACWLSIFSSRSLIWRSNVRFLSRSSPTDGVSRDDWGTSDMDGWLEGWVGDWLGDWVVQWRDDNGKDFQVIPV